MLDLEVELESFSRGAMVDEAKLRDFSERESSNSYLNQRTYLKKLCLITELNR